MSEDDKCYGEKLSREYATGEGLLFLNRMIEEGLTENMTFEQRI